MSLPPSPSKWTNYRYSFLWVYLDHLLLSRSKLHLLRSGGYKV